MSTQKQSTIREFPDSLAVRIWCFHCHSPDSISGWGTEIPQAVGHGQKKKKKVISNWKTIYEKDDICETMRT